MKKNKLLIISILFAVLLLFSMQNINFYKLAKAEPEYIEISSILDLQKIGNDANFPLTANYKLTTDLDFFDGENYLPFYPIGTAVNEITNEVLSIQAFSGIFDGDGHKIKNINIENSLFEFYYIGLFAKTENATIKNLAVENIKVNLTNAHPNVEDNNSTIFIGGVVGYSQNTIIQTTSAQFDSSLVSTSTSLYFGGLIGKMFAGSKIENSYSNADFTANINGEQASEVKIGGLVGSVENSKIKISHTKGNLKANVLSLEEISTITSTAVGGIAGYILGQDCEIITTYADVLVFAQNENLQCETLIGAFVGKITQTIAQVPQNDNLSYAKIYAKTLVKNGENFIETPLNQIFGQSSNYDSTNSNLSILSQNNYEIFQNVNLWSPYSNFTWNFETIWTFNAQSLPLLQIFTVYEIELKEQETRVNLGDDSSQVDVVSLDFVSGDGQFKNGENVQVYIALINDYDGYYNLESVEFNLVTKVTFGENSTTFSLTQIDAELTSYESEKVYLLSYTIYDVTMGDISVTLSKVPFTLTVESSDENMGLVRKRDSTIALKSFTQELQNANSYDFFAVPLNNNFAFLTWLYVQDENAEPIELGDYADFAQISFVFGINGEQIITSEILNGGKLVAYFTSNVSQVTFNLQLNDGTINNDIGVLTFSPNGENVSLNQVTAFNKQSPISVLASANEGYTFVGWYDQNNRLVASTQTLTYNFTEDEITIYARFVGEGARGNLTWLYITLGIIGGLGLGIGIFFLIRSKVGDKSYKNFY